MFHITNAQKSSEYACNYETCILGRDLNKWVCCGNNASKLSFENEKEYVICNNLKKMMSNHFKNQSRFFHIFMLYCLATNEDTSYNNFHQVAAPNSSASTLKTEEKSLFSKFIFCW